MSQPHYEYPSRNTWLGYQATKQEHVLTTNSNKMQDSNHVTSYPDWRQNSGDSYFPQVRFLLTPHFLLPHVSSKYVIAYITLMFFDSIQIIHRPAKKSCLNTSEFFLI